MVSTVVSSRIHPGSQGGSLCSALAVVVMWQCEFIVTSYLFIYFKIVKNFYNHIF